MPTDLCKHKRLPKANKIKKFHLVPTVNNNRLNYNKEAHIYVSERKLMTHLGSTVK